LQDSNDDLDVRTPHGSMGDVLSCETMYSKTRLCLLVKDMRKSPKRCVQSFFVIENFFNKANNLGLGRHMPDMWQVSRMFPPVDRMRLSWYDLSISEILLS
jgi:hypothetical protein